MTGDYSDYQDFWRRGPYAPFLQEQRSAGSTPARMFRATKPAGNFPDPPIPDFVVVLPEASWRASVDLGSGRWSGTQRPGELWAWSPNLAADISPETPAFFTGFAFSKSGCSSWLEEACPTFRDDLGRLHTSPFKDNLIEKLCRRLWEEAEADSPNGSLFADSIAQTIVLALLRKAEIGPAAPTVRKGGLAPFRLRRIEAIVRDRLGEDLELDELAQAAGLSSSYLVRAFRAETGLTPWRYLLTQRIERAKELLAGTDLPLIEVAKQCGFFDGSHLGQWFKRLTGVTPKQYRNERRN